MVDAVDSPVLTLPDNLLNLKVSNVSETLSVGSGGEHPRSQGFVCVGKGRVGLVVSTVRLLGLPLNSLGELKRFGPAQRHGVLIILILHGEHGTIVTP